MTKSQSAAPERLIIHCFHCKGTFDVFEAAWCDCLVREPTITCPKCAQCFCKAPQSYKTEFWLTAPGLLKRRLKELREDGAPARGKVASRFISAQAPDSTPLVLVVDDSRTVRMIAARAVSDMGFRVMEASNAEEALAMIREHYPALVLTDALMPKLDGREMCRIIKSDAKISYTVVVLMSGLYTANRYKTEALSVFGADAYLTKPVDPGQLRQVLAKYLIIPAREERLTA